jgi:tetratricopeptide (TPR) repeat protein
MRALLAVLAFLLWVAPAAADDAAPSAVAQGEELDQLFGRLQDKNLGAAALKTEARIWALWMQAGSDEENRMLGEATALMGSADFRLSEEMLNRLIAKTQTYPEAFNKRATLYYLMGKYDQSLADIVTTLDLEPRHFGALSGRGMILQKLGKNKEALEAYRHAAAINPHMPGAAIAIKQLEQLLPEL